MKKNGGVWQLKSFDLDPLKRLKREKFTLIKPSAIYHWISN